MGAPGPREVNVAWQEGLDVRNLVTVCGLMIASALEREETRGMQVRSDFPERDDAKWLRYITVRRAETGPRVETRPVSFTRLAPPAPAMAEARP
jgi:succinate dehydrogenase/fumarate reductase flavoprotein subunit